LLPIMASVGLRSLHEMHLHCTGYGKVRVTSVINT